MFEQLEDCPRLLFTVELEPVYGRGHRFQPTGFADLGAAIYQRPEPDGAPMCLVESAQSIANHLESTCVEGASVRLIPELEGLPYVLVKLEGASDIETSSLVEAHRLNSPFIIGNPQFRDSFSDRSGYARGRPLDWKKIAAGCLSKNRRRQIPACSRTLDSGVRSRWLVASSAQTGRARRNSQSRP